MRGKLIIFQNDYGKFIMVGWYYGRGRNNSNISGSQQDYLVEKSGSPQIYLMVIYGTDLSKIT